MFYETITLHFSPTASGERKHVPLMPAPVNIFVGTNGVGKSLALRELLDFSGHKKIVCSRSVRREELQEVLAWEGYASLYGDEMASQLRQIPERWHSDLSSFRHPLDARGTVAGTFLHQVGRHEDQQRVKLSVSGSLSEIAKGGRGRFSGGPASRLDALFRGPEPFRREVFETYGLYPVVNATQGGLVLRLSRVPPPAGIEHALTLENERFMDETIDPAQLSDGSQSYLGILGHLRSGEERLIFLDEAGSMLHPPLARKLGKQLASVAAERRGHLFAATHSADFLLGSIQAGCKVNVIRLTYRDGISTVRVLSAEDLRPLMYDPLLRSANVLSGLFHDGVVVGEADADRAFYQQINERLLEAKEGMPSAHFVNAQNWQTIPRIAGALRSLGIPTAMLIDLDAVIHPDMSKLLECAGVPQPIQKGWGQTRGELAKDFATKEARAQLKREGLAMISSKDLPGWRKHLSDLEEYGIFTVPVGELEGWLPEFEVPRGRKGEWIVKIFEKMGADPGEPDYLRPGADGPWAFMRRVASWIHDPERSGMPTFA